MKNTRYKGSGLWGRPSEFAGDMTVWLRENAEDNNERLERLKKGLRMAREEELTPRQAQMLEMYFDQGMHMTDIAQELGVHRSTVSRTLARAKRRLYRCLRFGL